LLGRSIPAVVEFAALRPTSGYFASSFVFRVPSIPYFGFPLCIIQFDKYMIGLCEKKQLFYKLRIQVSILLVILTQDLAELEPVGDGVRNTKLEENKKWDSFDGDSKVLWKQWIWVFYQKMMLIVRL